MSEMTNFSVFDTSHKFQKENFLMLRKTEVFELTLFLLYILGKLPEYHVASGLMLMTTQNTFMRICEYFGGETITIPTINELQDMLGVIDMYNSIDIKGVSYDAYVLDKKISPDTIVGYNKLKLLLEGFGIENPCGGENEKSRS